MKKFAKMAVVFTLIASMFAMTANAGTIYQGGGAAQNQVQGNAGALVIEVPIEPAVNLGDADTLFVRIYVDDPAAMEGQPGQIELTSSGVCDQDEDHWVIDNYEFEKGWNVLELDLTAPDEASADPAAINYFRIYKFTDGDNVLALDYVAYGSATDDFTSLATDMGEIVKEEIVPKDSLTRESSGDAGSIAASMSAQVTPVDISKYDTLFVRLYVEGIGNYTSNGQLELGSKFVSDAQEVHWDVNNLDLQDGWNEIKLTLADADEYPDDFDPTRASWFRIYMFTEGTLKVNLDYVGFGSASDNFSESLPAYLVKPISQDPLAGTTAEGGTIEIAEDGTTSGDAATAPATDTGASTGAAQTADYGIAVAAAVLAASCAVIAISKKRSK